MLLIIVSYNGVTPLKCAARYGNVDIAKLLLASGALVNEEGDVILNSVSALQYACKESCLKGR